MDKFMLRNLEEKDALLMYEWMHDENVVENLKTDFKNKTIEDCQKFIRESLKDERNIHYAVVNEQDEYLGTVSIKNINYIAKTGEFAITIRKSAMGSGCSTFAIHEIIKYGFGILGLKKYIGMLVKII